MVVMNGDAMTAGSRPSFCAAIGRVQPTSFASTMVMISVRQTTSATSGEILYNLQQSFRRATKLDDNDLMMASLKESAETLPEDEKGIINGILQNPEEEVRKIIEQFLNKNFWVEDETSQVGKGL